MYKQRFYRDFDNASMFAFEVKCFESDLFILAGKELRLAAQKSLEQVHGQIRDYAQTHPDFLHSLTPIPVDDSAPAVIQVMQKAAQAADVGPMAAVAGAVAEFVGRALLELTDEVIVENGGDIFLSLQKERRVGIFAGLNNAFNRIFLRVLPEQTPCGICTSSGRIGHSLSFGKAHACMVMSASAAVADAWATSLANVVRQENDFTKIEKALSKQQMISGVVVATSEKIMVCGNVCIGLLDK